MKLNPDYSTAYSNKGIALAKLKKIQFSY
ncbi:hypothetical protein [Rickettsia felis]